MKFPPKTVFLPSICRVRTHRSLEFDHVIISDGGQEAKR